MRDTGNGRKLYYIEDKDIITILFRNFSKAPDTYHPDGPSNANFWVVLYPEKARELADAGFNIRQRMNRDDEEEFRLQVFISDRYFPTVTKVCGKVKTVLDPETIKSLDRDELEKVDLVISGGRWEYGGKSGVKCWLDKGYFTIVKDRFDDMYNFDEEDEEDIPFKED